MITVLLVDDHAVVRAGYRRLLEQHPGVRVVAEAGSGEQAYQCFVRERPDVVVMDLKLPGMGGLEAIRRILRRDPGARILVFSMYEEALFAERAMQAGAVGYITKSSAPEVLIEAVERVSSGRIFLGPDIREELALAERKREANPLGKLSPREFEVFRLLAEGRGTADIARLLGVSYKTVANYSTGLRNKLQVSTTAELVHLAIQHGVVTA